MTSDDSNDFESAYLNGSKSRLSISGHSDTLRDLLGERKYSVDSLNIALAEKEADEFMKQLCEKEVKVNTEMNSSDVKGTRSLDGYKVDRNVKNDLNGNEYRGDVNTNRQILLERTDASSQLTGRGDATINQRNSDNTLNHTSLTEGSINSHGNEKKDNYSSVLMSKKREITKQLSDSNQHKYFNERKKDLNLLQERYSQAIEDFKIFRSNLTENMEKNLHRTEQLNLQHKKGDHYRSYDDILRNNFDISSRTQSDVAFLRNKNIERYSSQERLYKRRSDINIDEKLPEEYFNNSPRLFSNNNVDMKGHMMLTSRDYTTSSEMQREHHIHLRDQAAKSNFERYLRGSLQHTNNIDSSVHNNNNSGFEDHDIGYGGSGSTSPRELEIMMPSDQLSSRSGSINSHHSRTSSALASVDSGVRMSYVGQHNSLVVVAIDFGTTFSGYAFSFTRDSSSIHMMRRWEGGDPGVTNQKTPTTLLLKPDGSFHSFGFGARDFYHDLDASDSKKWLYFDKFKMALHSSEDLHAGIEIKAANGKSYPALKVFSHALRFFKQHVLAELSDQSTAKLSEEDITWVLTVPAIWRQPAKQFMRTAAYEAGIASLDHPDRLLIALEPEAASIFCRKLRIRDCVIEDDLKAKAGDYSLISEDFEGITQYIVVDCGGGTVDLTVHELDVTQGTLKELHKGTGGPCGATGVDREFEKLLKRIFDADFIERFKMKRPAAWIDLMISFEAKKRTARPDNQSPLNLSLPFSFIEYHKKHRKCSVETAVKKFKNPEIKWSSQGMLRFSANIMQTLFEPVVNDIIGHIQNLLTKASLKHVEHLFLVGGFAESPLLQYNIREALEGRVRVIIPNDVGLAILKGAVLFGLDPTVVRVRRSAYTYGVGVLNKFDPEKHEQSKRVVKDGIVWCKDIFDRFVRVDESVGIGDRVTRSYAPARSKQKSTVINIYCTEKLDVLYTTDKGVTRCGKLRIEMPDVNPEDIPLEKRGKPRELQASMIFGDTEIKVAAVDVLSGRAARANIDFLNY